MNIISEGDDKDLTYAWTRNGIQLTSTPRVKYQLRGINFTDGQGGMNRSDLGVYKLTISNFAGKAVTYLTLDVQCECIGGYTSTYIYSSDLAALIYIAETYVRSYIMYIRSS